MPSVLLDSIMARDEPKGFYATLTAPYEPESSLTHVLDSLWSMGSTSEEPTRSTGNEDFADMRSNEIEDRELLAVLDAGSTSIKSGCLFGKRITYMSKLWSSSQADDCTRELELYKSAKHLKPLQGVVVPRILNVSTTLAAIEVALELPQKTFWIEASPDMPRSLKQRCVEAFERLHQRGVLHGNVELRNMLIGADCKASIIDFHHSRSSNPIPEAGVQLATPEDFALEMRRVKFKLNYLGSRTKEHAKMFRSVELLKNNKRISQELGKWVRPVDFQQPLEEDLVEPAVPAKNWSQEWLIGCEIIPRRFIVPGRSMDEFHAALDGFVDCVGKMESLKGLRSSTPDPAYTEKIALKRKRRVEVPSSETSSSDSDGVQTAKRRRFNGSDLLRSASHSLIRFAPPPSDIVPPHIIPESQQVISPHEKKSSPKRKLAEELIPCPTLGNLVELAEGERETKRRKCSLTSITAEYGSDSERYLSPPPPENDDSATSNSQRASPGLSAIARVTLTTPKPAPPIIARDYINKPYNGPKGYYVPYPPMENRVGMERAKYIRLQNAQKCVELGLRYPTVENTDGEMIPQINPLPYNFKVEEEQGPVGRKRKRKARGLGTLTRRRNKEQIGEDERRDLELARLWEEAQRGTMSAVRFPRSLTASDTRTSRSAVHDTRGILKKPAPIKVFNYQEPWKQSSDEELSPKLGPLREEYDRSGGFGMLGVKFHHDIPRTEETMRREIFDRVRMSETFVRDEEEAWMEEERRMEVLRRDDWACNEALDDLVEELEVEELLIYREHNNKN